MLVAPHLETEYISTLTGDLLGIKSNYVLFKKHLIAEDWHLANKREY